MSKIIKSVKIWIGDKLWDSYDTETLEIWREFSEIEKEKKRLKDSKAFLNSLKKR